LEIIGIPKHKLEYSMRFQFLLGDSNYFKLFPIYSNFCLGIPIFQLFGTIGEMGCGGARAFLP
jgi:hypothetical protein